MPQRSSDHEVDVFSVLAAAIKALKIAPIEFHNIGFSIGGKLTRDSRRAFGPYIARNPLQKGVRTMSDSPHGGHCATARAQVERVRRIGLDEQRGVLVPSRQISGNPAAHV